MSKLITIPETAGRYLTQESKNKNGPDEEAVFFDVGLLTWPCRRVLRHIPS